MNNIKFAVYYYKPGARQTTQKLVHFYMSITQKHKKVVEKSLFMVKTHLFNEHNVVVAQWKCLYSTNNSSECSGLWFNQ